jgi:hypothetical protein
LFDLLCFIIILLLKANYFKKYCLLVAWLHIRIISGKGAPALKYITHVSLGLATKPRVSKNVTNVGGIGGWPASIHNGLEQLNAEANRDLHARGGLHVAGGVQVRLRERLGIVQVPLEQGVVRSQG